MTNFPAMKSALLLVLAATALVACAAHQHHVGYPAGDITKHEAYVNPSILHDVPAQKALWSSWKAKFERTYASPAEDSFRFLLFQNTLHRIVEKNAKLPKNLPNFGLNRFADMDTAEWANMYLSTKPSLERKAEVFANTEVNEPEITPSQLPLSWDWRDQNVVTDVKDQGQCGSCWAFSTVETVESGIALATKNLNDLSPQQIVDCDWTDGNQGCDGGDPYYAYQYVTQYGLMTDAEYPYYSGDSGINYTCAYVPAQATAKIQNYSWAAPPCWSGDCNTQNDITLALNLYTNGPTGIIVDASGWQDYTWGVFSQCSNAYADMDHGVQVVGFNTDSKPTVPGTVDYWIVRNSWDSTWGNDGYIYLAGSTSYNNTCGITNEALQVIV